MSVELRLVLAVAALVAAFAAGAWWGARDRLCVTAPANNGGTIVWCAKGQPAEGSLDW